MDFPLSKTEHDILQIVEDRFKKCRIVSFTKKELMEYQDILNLLCEKRVLKDADIDNTDAYMLIGSFEGFRKRLKIIEEKCSSNYFDMNGQTNILFTELLEIANSLAINATYNESSKENEMNDYVRDMLKFARNFEIMDQSRHGLSTMEKGAGSVDLLVSKNGNEVAIIEGLILESVEKSIISSHINKAIINYNPLSKPVFLLSYVKASNYSSFWDKCFSYLSNYQFPNDIIVKEGFESHTFDNGAVRVAKCSIAHNDVIFPVHFIAIKLLKTLVQTK
ncbi:MAG: hypothetical protein HDT22_10965 [Ruminococcus sp.]|nr:hypothetical protein [Ruminococcus sp.]